MKITTVGIDLAKNVFQIHGVDQRGKVVVRKRLRRQQVLTYFANHPPCLVGMEACGGAYLRTLMIHGARSVVRVAERKSTPTDRWSTDLLERRHMNVVAVARANKNARIVWALLAQDRDYRVGYVSAA